MAAVFIAACVGGCGGNSTKAGIAITGPSASPVSVLVNGTAQFSASVTGVSTTTVFWQICLPPTNVSLQPTNCTQGQGPDAPVVKTPLTGYGTITSTGLYTAPPSVPAQNNFYIVATSTVQPTNFGTITVIVDTGARVAIDPTNAIIGPGESFQFTATVSGLSSNAVSWTICEPASGTAPATCGPSETGFGSISATGLYTAPIAPTGASVTVKATATADTSQSATAAVTIASSGATALTSIDPIVAAQGSAQQDVYLTGSNFLNTSTVTVNGIAVPTTFISTALLRATIPAAQLAGAGSLSIAVQAQNGDLNSPGPSVLSVLPVGPAVVATSPDSVSQNASSAAVSVTGGFFVSGVTSATFNGAAAVTSPTSSRQLSVSIPSASLSTPGLYPIILHNSGVPVGQASEAAANLAVEPVTGTIPSAPLGTVGVGSNPSAVAFDQADGLAVVANAGSNSISLISIGVGSGTVTATIPVGNNPVGVAVDDLLPHAVALVVNKNDQTISAVDLTTHNAAILAIPLVSGANPPLPVAVGVNPVTHRAIVAYQSTNEATVLDVSDTAGTPAVTIVQQVGGSNTNFTTGLSPAVAVDPGLNWAVITPGGAGTINVVDLGLDKSTSEPAGRSPEVIANLSINPTVQGVALNSVTHQVLFTDPQTGTLATFSLLNNTVTPITTSGTTPGQFDVAGFGAAAATPLENVAVAVNANSSAVVVDLENSVVLQTVTGLGHAALSQAAAVDPLTNQVIVANQGDGTVSIVSLGPAPNPLQITESSPILAFGGLSAANLTLTIDGSGFTGGSQVQLDGTSVAVSSVSANGRQIIATVPASMLTSPRRYFIQVQTNSAVSNVAYLTVVEPVAVGRDPVGVAIDTDRDLAVATNSEDGTVSLVSIAAPSALAPESLGAVGVIGSPVSVGTTPEGVAALPRLGVALVANNGSNNASVVDVTGVNVPVTVAICSSGCDDPTGAAVDADHAIGLVTDTNAGLGTPLGANGTASLVDLSGTTAALDGSVPVDQDPVAAAFDPDVASNPGISYAAVATATSSSNIDILSTSTQSIIGRASNGSLENPSGVVFDPLNQIFLVANSLLNNLVFVDPNTFVITTASVGVNPTSLDYNFQTSTLVTLNASAHLLSVLDYLCPPSVVAPSCTQPRVRDVIGVGGQQTSNFVLGPNAIAVDPKLNLAVVVDPDNNRILLVPLP